MDRAVPVRLGAIKVPTKRMALLAIVLRAIVGVLLGIGCGFMASEAGAGIFVGGLVAVVFLVAGLVSGRWWYRKAVEYELAEAEYQRRRADTRSGMSQGSADKSDE
jgi:hypothetical protein